jgi:hypothetical protein
MFAEINYSGEAHRRNWAWFHNLQAPVIAAADGHAFVCAGVRSFAVDRAVYRLLYVLDPGERNPSWRSFPACGSLDLAFAFRARRPTGSA